jgi:hypothetical protein
MPYQIRLENLRREQATQAERLRELKAAAIEVTSEDSKEKFAVLIKEATMSMSDLDILVKAFTARQEEATRSQENA